MYETPRLVAASQPMRAVGARLNSLTMGIYLTFWHCHPAGLAEEFVSGPLEEFGAWCEEITAEFPDDIAPAVHPLLMTVQARGVDGLRATTRAEATAVDRLMDTYFGMFCDMSRPGLKRAADPSLLPVRHFRGMFGDSQRICGGGSAFELWNFIFTGRAVGRDSSLLPYVSDDGVYRLAYWSSKEVIRLGEAFADKPAPNDIDVRAVEAAQSAVTRACEQGTGVILQVA